MSWRGANAGALRADNDLRNWAVLRPLLTMCRARPTFRSLTILTYCGTFRATLRALPVINRLSSIALMCRLRFQQSRPKSDSDSPPVEANRVMGLIDSPRPLSAPVSSFRCGLLRHRRGPAAWRNSPCFLLLFAASIAMVLIPVVVHAIVAAAFLFRRRVRNGSRFPKNFSTPSKDEKISAE